MEKTNLHEELQSRREFFKKAAKSTLPILGLLAFGPAIMSSCDEDDDDGGSSGCGQSCSGSCDSGCSNNCDSLCGGDCWSYCESTARR